MSKTSIPRLDLQDWQAGGDRRDAFVATLGHALSDIGFFALTGHGVDGQLLSKAYDQTQAFFALSDEEKRRYFDAAAKAQRGFTPFGTEQALGAQVPDLKEFYQVGRTNVPDDHPVHHAYGPNIWPQASLPDFREAVCGLYEKLDEVAGDLMRACAVFLGEPPELFDELTDGGDTILRLIHYPALSEAPPDGAVRAGAHEDINLITILVGATADGLELLERDGSWRAVEAGHEDLIVDTGDMMQNLTNGLLRSVTHRVVLPEGAAATRPRFSMPFFVHPARNADLTPRANSVAKTGGKATYPAIDAHTLLEQRLNAIGLG